MNLDSPRGTRLREQRKKLRLKQAEAAAACLVSREMWGKYERGIATPGGPVLAAMSTIGIDIEYVLNGQPTRVRGALDAVRASSEIASRFENAEPARASLQEAIFNALRAAQPDADEQELLDSYRRADETAKSAILTTAAALASGQSVSRNHISASHGSIAAGRDATVGSKSRRRRK